MVDPKTSLALDAPPLAPYDDGFSTESEDLEGPDESQDMELHITVSAAVRRAAVGENRAFDEEQSGQIWYAGLRDLRVGNRKYRGNSPDCK
ncbi:uncharacterized protein IUM83_03766 [Phytophthora cinnamomi]|uniref:uncharacterized protein n=1 Tax=Phytophthora cinnamomi TaxID=4785 RepID=UPI0035594676|nr:hypothetical protein IUM83_03766 [Phytophthora cinnamomi]